MGTGYFPEVKRPGRGSSHPPPSNAEVKERVELYLYLPPSVPSWPVTGWNLTLPLAIPRARHVSEVCPLEQFMLIWNVTCLVRQTDEFK